ncbi:MAG: hypothetical protein EOO62_20965 [Hymenobacter sp.]|nr:MAG: hypothetical protein EOO62_20965 [Hymenobacter sp.]
MATRIGVVTGRFQVPRLALHPGYRALLAHVAHENDAVLVVLGEAPQPGPRHPLSFRHRAAMFAEEYPTFRVQPLPDEPSDDAWVRHLDELITSALPAGPSATVQLYGGRGSFLDTYHRHGGRFATAILPDLTSPHHCATDIRRRIGQEQRSSVGIRTGLIQAWENATQALACVAVGPPCSPCPS